MHNIESAMNKLNVMCDGNALKNVTKCENYKKHYREDLKDMIVKNQNFKELGNREKRAIKFKAKYFVNVLMAASVGGITWSLTDDIKANRLADISTKSEMLTLHRSLLQVQLNSTKFQSKVHSKLQEFMDLMTALTLMKLDYLIKTTDYVKLLNNEWNRNVFDVIEYDEFIYLVNEAKKNLTKGYTLPDISLKNLYSLCKLYADKNTTHITITISIPVISAKRSIYGKSYRYRFLRKTKLKF